MADTEQPTFELYCGVSAVIVADSLEDAKRIMSNAMLDSLKAHSPSAVVSEVREYPRAVVL